MGMGIKYGRKTSDEKAVSQVCVGYNQPMYSRFSFNEGTVNWPLWPDYFSIEQYRFNYTLMA